MDWLIRPIAPSDLDGLEALAGELGPGMTTLPADRGALARKIERSVASFASADGTDADGYLLVLVDRDTDVLIGCAGIYPRVGDPHGFFSYRRARQVHHCRPLGASAVVDLLHPCNDFTGATEVGTLAVAASARRSGAGRFLARARYLLMAAHPARFAPLVMAEMRGWQDAEGRSPFWDAVGARFFKMDFARADRLSAIEGAHFIADLLPKIPICLDLLPEAARSAVGVAHPSSALAMNMLLSEGFRYDGLVDVFDAGPQVSAARGDIATIRFSRRGEVLPAACAVSTRVLAANPAIDRFRVAVASVEMIGDAVLMAPEDQQRLVVDGGSAVLIAPLHTEPAAPAHPGRLPAVRGQASATQGVATMA